MGCGCAKIPWAWAGGISEFLFDAVAFWCRSSALEGGRPSMSAEEKGRVCFGMGDESLERSCLAGLVCPASWLTKCAMLGFVCLPSAVLLFDDYLSELRSCL